jgi:hypothetical protein
MTALWSCIAALALAWLAGDAVLGLLVAPQLFIHAREAGLPDAVAGTIFGELLSRWVVSAGLLCVIPIAILLGAVAGRALKLHGWRGAAKPMLACLMALGIHVSAATLVDRGQATWRELRTAPDAQRLADFRGSYHQRMRLVFGLEMLIALGLATGAIIAAHRSSRLGAGQ